VATTLEQVLQERVSVTENGKRKNIRKLEAMLKQLANKAAAGDHRNLLALHPTVKPAALIADAITDCTSRRDIVLDGFLGSGTTVIAAERTGRRCYGMDIDPLYVDVTARRWQGFTREPARHANTGRCFNDIEAAGGRR
jgi:DNA modification methylase